MGTQNRSSQRRGNQMARANKTITSNHSDDHLGRERTLREDSIKQTAIHTNKVREKKELPPLEILDLVIGLGSADDEVNNQILADAGDLEMIQNSGLIVGLRAYSGRAGAPVGENEFTGIHRRVRRERVRYRELNGVMVALGETVPRFDATKKDKNTNKKIRNKETRDVPGILRSIMVRLMPTEAVAVGESGMTRNNVEAAMDKTVAAFEQATGCQVVTAVTHRMSVTDLHIHIQYTLVLPFNETSHMLGRRLKPWKAEASRQARASLGADGIEHPSPAQIGARKKNLIADGLIAPSPQAGIEYRKMAGKRDLGDGAILGYSFRQKLNLVRAAEAGGECELADLVTRRNDERWRRFAPIAARNDDDLEEKYLDLWLERVWRRNVTSKLPEEYRDRLIVAGVEAAKNYANYGSSIVEETHLKRKIKELNLKAQEIELQQETAKKAEHLAHEMLRAAEEEREQLAVEKRKLEEQSARITELESDLAAVKKPMVEEIVEREIVTEVVPQKLLKDHAAALDQSKGLLERIRIILGIKEDVEIISMVNRVVGEACKVSDLNSRNRVLENDLKLAEVKVDSLETEIGPLRKLKEAVVSFLKAVMENPMKLGDSLIKMLKEMGVLVGEKFEPKKKDDPGMPI